MVSDEFFGRDPLPLVVFSPDMLLYILCSGPLSDAK